MHSIREVLADRATFLHSLHPEKRCLLSANKVNWAKDEMKRRERGREEENGILAMRKA